MSDTDDEMKQRVAGALREIRAQARTEPAPRQQLAPYPATGSPAQRLDPVSHEKAPATGTSPDREFLNEKWDVSRSLDTPSRGRLGRLLAPLRRPLVRVIRFALGPLVERQAEWNSAQVKFDNELVSYLDERLDRISAHYDFVLGQHGKRMEEMDERHLILQQELIQHVHDLIKRIDFVFETAEQNHLYLEGSLREIREELDALTHRSSSAAAVDPQDKDAI